MAIIACARLGHNDKCLILVGSKYSLAFDDASPTIGRDGQPRES